MQTSGFFLALDKIGAPVQTGIQLIVGLGNPGAEYAKTRHNAGEWFIRQIAESANADLRKNAKFHGLHDTIKLHQQECHLLIPTTFMNLSGQSVQAVASYYKIPPENILVAHDEIDLSVGDIRLKFDGGHGGHNGLRDIISHLGSNKFYRLRIGVGRPAHSKDVHDYVLHPPKKPELELINIGIEKAIKILPLLMEGKCQQAMMNLHTNND